MPITRRIPEITNEISTLRLPGMEIKDKVERSEARVAFYTKKADLFHEFKTALASEYAVDLSPVTTTAIYAKAVEQGHANGFDEIEWKYVEMVQLVNLALENR